METEKLVGILLALILVFYLAGCIANYSSEGNQNNNSGNANTNEGGNISGELIVEAGDTVKVNYTGTLDNGEEFDSSLKEGRTPLEFVVGAGQMIPGFDKAVQGMKLNEEKTIKLSPEEAYGTLNDELIVEIPKTQFGDLNGLAVGAIVHANTGQQAKVLEIKDDTIKLDFNHPLAGENLTFWIQVVEITKAENQEQ